jgi:phosphate transport system substrate-binding protein
LTRKRFAGIAAAALMATVASSVATATAGATITGAGSTLVQPLVEKWKTEFEAKDSIPVTYAGVGSGTGIAQIIARTVDFGASDAPLTPTQASECKGCVLVPWGLTATAVGYRLDGVESLKLTGPVLAKIYKGEITNWDNSAIAKLNPGESLPNLAITPVHRSDGSGDTYAFTHYLSKVSSAWAHTINYSTQVTFPGGIGAAKNSGVAAVISSTNGAIGYVSAAYLIEKKNVKGAAIQNAAGKFEYPNLKPIEAAAATIKKVPANNEVSIVDPSKKAKRAYPISTFTYAIIPKATPIKSEISKFVEYAIGPGQAFGAALDFAPLPKVVLKADKKTIKALT